MNWVKQLRVYSNALFLISKNPSPAIVNVDRFKATPTSASTFRPSHSNQHPRFQKLISAVKTCLPHRLSREIKHERIAVCFAIKREGEGKGERERRVVKMKKSSRYSVYEKRVRERRDKDEPRVRICYSRCAVSPSVRPLILIHKRGRSCETVGRWSVTGRSHRLIYALFVAIAIRRGFPSSLSKRREEF